MYTERMCSRTLCTPKIGFRNDPLVGRQGVLSLVLSLARFGEEKFEEEAREEKRRGGSANVGRASRSFRRESFVAVKVAAVHRGRKDSSCRACSSCRPRYFPRRSFSPCHGQTDGIMSRKLRESRLRRFSDFSNGNR